MELFITSDRLTLDGRDFAWDADDALGALPARAADLRAACSAITDYEAARDRWGEAALATFGTDLFATLFPPGSDRRAAFEDATGPLILTAQGELANLPWELLRDEAGWLSHERGVLRRVGQMVTDLPPPAASSLDILMTVASPLLAPDPDLPSDHPAQPGILEVEGEWQALRDALGELGRAVHARLLPHATLPALDDALGDPTAVLYLNAHGEVGRVLLEDGRGRGVEVAADRLRAPVRRAGLRLAVLCSCLTGAELLLPQQPGDDLQRVPSVARVLLEAGVPLTLAMQAPMFVGAGRHFTTAFYHDLARGRSVNEAVALARRGLSAEAGQPGVAPWSWAIPALYIAAPAEWATVPLTQGSRGEFETDDPRPPAPGFPQPTGRFVGRRAEQVAILETLDWARDSRPRVLGLLGSGGVGKTALALAVTPRLLPRLGRSGRAVWAAARPTLPPGELPEHVAAAVFHHLAADEREFLADLATGLGLGREEAGRLEVEGLVEWIVADLSHGPRTLLVLDNLESLFERRACPERGRRNGTYRLAPATAGLLTDLPRQVRALCTSRQALAVNEERLTLAPLPPFDAGLLARAYAAHWRVDLSPRALQNLVQGTGGHPLAMRLVIARIADLEERDVREALARLLTERERVPDDEAFFRYLYDESLARAGADGEALFSALALFATHARRDALAAALEWQDERVGGAMGRLRDLSLALEGQAWDGEDVLVLEPPARAQATRLLAVRPEAEKWALRVVQFFRDYARQFGTAMDTVEATRQARKLADEQLDVWMLPRLPKEMHSQYAGLFRIEKENLAVSFVVAQARAALETERANVGAAIQWAAEAGEHALVDDLVDAVYSWLNQAGYWREAVEHGRVALAAAREGGDERAVAVWAHNLAVTLDGLGEKEEAEALYAEAERVLAAPEHQKEMAAVLHQQGILAQSRGDYDAALEHYRRSLEIEGQLGDRKGVATCLHWIGTIHQLRGDYAAALEHYRRSLRTYEQLGDWGGMANSYGQLGTLFHAQGQWDEALKSHEQALVIFEQLGDRARVAYTMGNIGYVHRARGDWQEALEAFEQVRQISEDMGDRPSVAKGLHAIGMVHQDQGDEEAALEHYRRSLEIKEQLGDRAGVARTLNAIGLILQHRGDYEAALDHFQHSLQGAEAIGDRQQIATVLHAIGMVHQDQGDQEAALEHYRGSLETFEQLGDRAGVAKSLHQIGRVHEDMGRCEEARKFVQRALKIALDIGDPVATRLAASTIARVSLELEEPEVAAQHFALALSVGLQVHPREALSTLAQVVNGAKRLVAAGQAEAAGGMAAAGLHVVETLLEKLQGERQQAAALCRAVLQVIGLLAAGERQQALEQAQEVDEATEGMFGLVQWLGQLPGAISQT